MLYVQNYGTRRDRTASTAAEDCQRCSADTSCQSVVEVELHSAKSVPVPKTRLAVVKALAGKKNWLGWIGFTAALVH